jgi:hypothetical protein
MLIGSTSVLHQKVDLRRTFHFDTQIHPEVRGFINLFSICSWSPVRFGTIRAKWKTCLKLSELNYCNQLRIVTAIKRQKVRKLQETCNIKQYRKGNQENEPSTLAIKTAQGIGDNLSFYSAMSNFVIT